MIETAQNTWHSTFSDLSDLNFLAPDQELEYFSSIVVGVHSLTRANSGVGHPPGVTEFQNAFERICSALTMKGFLWVCGEPEQLAPIGVYLSDRNPVGFKLIFKYWIALDLTDRLAEKFLNRSHKGLLLFIKMPPDSSEPAILHFNSVRVPYLLCPACEETVKDWGGKKHLMNPRGAALSDVWRGSSENIVSNCSIPDFALETIKQLTAETGGKQNLLLELNRSQAAAGSSSGNSELPAEQFVEPENDAFEFRLDEIYVEDCISFLRKTAARHPEGSFDLVFADPPYNLKKAYDSYDDGLTGQHYLTWCETWLEGLCRNLKPGGALFLLNLPKWAMHHLEFLRTRLEFRHWIVWDALSDPRGKLMPAHYSLLYFTKPGASPVFNLEGRVDSSESECVAKPDSPDYCLRPACVAARKQAGDDRKCELSDVWWDIHRIKHKRDRDAHPCQLPEKLLERIVTLTTREGDLIFDPFCGSGTTAIVAKRLGRHFVTTEIETRYVALARERLNSELSRQPTVKKRYPFSKRKIEQFLQNLASELGRVPTETDIDLADPAILGHIDAVYTSRSAAIKRCRIVLGNAY